MAELRDGFRDVFVAPAGSSSSRPSGANRITAGSGAGRLRGPRAGERKGRGPWRHGGRSGPLSTGTAGGGLEHGGRGGLGVQEGPPARCSRQCNASAAGYHGDALEKIWESAFSGVYPLFLAARYAWFAAAASGGEVAGQSTTLWTRGGLARKVRRSSPTPRRLGSWLRTKVH